MARLTVNDLSCYYEESGTGTPLLLIHGHPFDCTMWRPQLAAGLPGWLIAPDLRNFGKTTSPNGPTRWSTYAQDLLGFADALGVKKFAAAGLSMGGQIALEIAALAPGRLLGLALCDTFAQLDTPEKKAGRYALAERIDHGGIKNYAVEVLPKMICQNTIQIKPEVAKELREMMQRAPAAGASAALRMRVQRRDYLPLLGSLQMPVLIVVGIHDQFTPVEDAQLMHAEIPNSNLVIIKDAAHVTNIEQPEVFNDALGQFLQAIG